MGHEQKPKHQTHSKGPEFKTTAAQRLASCNEDKKLKSKVQGQMTMKTACTEDHNGLWNCPIDLQPLISREQYDLDICLKS